MLGQFLEEVMTGQKFIREWEKGFEGKRNSMCEGSGVRACGVAGGKFRKGPLSTSCTKC